MNEIDINEVELKLKIFLKEKTYTYLKINSNGYFLHYNGYITECNKEYILFKEDVLGEIPIIKNNIETIEISNKKGDDEVKNGDTKTTTK